MQKQSLCERLSGERADSGFYREDQSRNTKRGGHGIGLSMAKSLIETNKGRIYSTIDSNSKIHFIITFR